MLLLLLCGCARKFIYATDEKLKEYGTLIPVKIDTSYDLYLRQVVKVFDSVSRVYIAGNGQVANGIELIELEYLFISKTDPKKILVINNIANKRKVFYNNDAKKLELAPGADTTKVDIWYFSQFRFGRDSSGDFVFENVENEGFNHRWDVSFKNDTACLNAIGVYDKFGEDTRNANEAFAFPVYFIKVKDFKFFIKDYTNGRDVDLPEFEPVDKTFYLAYSKKKWHVIFRFDTTVRTHYRNIIFEKNRVYAAPRLPQ